MLHRHSHTANRNITAQVSSRRALLSGDTPWDEPTTTSHGRGPWETSSRWTERRAHARRGRRRPARPRHVLLRPRVAVDVPRGRARRRLFPALRWRPAVTEALHAGQPALRRRRARGGAGRRRGARRELQMPLVWPDRYPRGRAPRCASRRSAAERGRAAPSSLAAGRLAFCGGFDLDDPEVLAEAAAAAGLGLSRSWPRRATAPATARSRPAGRRLLAAGADRLPALRVGRRCSAASSGSPRPPPRSRRPRAGAARGDAGSTPPADAPADRCWRRVAALARAGRRVAVARRRRGRIGPGDALLGNGRHLQPRRA